MAMKNNILKYLEPQPAYYYIFSNGGWKIQGRTKDKVFRTMDTFFADTSYLYGDGETGGTENARVSVYGRPTYGLPSFVQLTTYERRYVLRPSEATSEVTLESVTRDSYSTGTTVWNTVCNIQSHLLLINIHIWKGVLPGRTSNWDIRGIPGINFETA
jgi:hypothetical protein